MPGWTWTIGLLEKLRTIIRQETAKHPVLSLAIIISLSISLLPIISAAVLMPVAFALDLSNFLASQGLVYIIYVFLFQGLALGVLLIFLFIAAFSMGTSVCVLQSLIYKIKK